MGSSLDAKITDCEKQLARIEKEQKNIVDAIAQGFGQSAFLDKMNELENAKKQITDDLLAIKSKTTSAISEDVIRKVLGAYKHHVTSKNIPECKKFIEKYVHKVIVSRDTVRVILTLDGVVDFNGGGGGIRTRVRRCTHSSFYGCSSRVDLTL